MTPQRTQTDCDDSAVVLIDGVSVYVRYRSHARQRDDDSNGRVESVLMLLRAICKSVLDLYAHVATDADRAAADLTGARLFARPDDAEARSAP